MARRADDPAGDRAEGTISEVIGAILDSIASWRNNRSSKTNEVIYGEVGLEEEEESIPLVSAGSKGGEEMRV